MLFLTDTQDLEGVGKQVQCTQVKAGYRSLSWEAMCITATALDRQLGRYNMGFGWCSHEQDGKDVA